MSHVCYGLLWLRRWLAGLISIRAATSLLSAFGTLWLTVEIAAFFLEGTEWPNWIRTKWLWFGASGLVLAAYICRPKLSVTHKVDGRDVRLSLMVGDVFSVPGTLIVGSNTTFDTRVSKELISEKSIQGAFTKKYYDSEAQIDAEIDAALKDVKSQKLHGRRVGKDKDFPVGTCVRLSPKGAVAIFVAIASINEHGVASGDFNGLQTSLANLWTFIANRGAKDSVVMGVLGSGYCRLPQPREQIIRAIVQSFIAACSERVFTDHLTIVVSPADAAKNGLSLDELGDFIRYNCKYAPSTSKDQLPIGSPA